MTYKEMLDLVRYKNPIIYFRIPFFHKELLGLTKPCNSFQLMHLLGSEKNMDHYEKVKVPEHCICHIPLCRFSNTKIPARITDAMAKQYPWYKLAESIEKEGFRIPVVGELYPNGIYVAIEGKHRVAATSIIKPFNKDYLIPTIPVVRDVRYTVKMYKQPHPDPLRKEGYNNFSCK